MKNLILILLALAVTLPALSQTNGVLGSALPSASTPLAGTESVFVIQSGTTKKATVDQLLYRATSAATAYSNSLQGKIDLLTAQDASTTASITTLASTLGSQLSANSTSISTASNALSNRITGTNNAILSYVGATFYPTSNPSGFQTAAQVQNTANAAAAAAVAGAVTTNGTPSFSAVIYAVTNLGNFTGSSSLTVNMAGAALQRFSAEIPNGTTRTLTVSFSNISVGQSVTVICQNNSQYAGTTTLNVALPSGTMNFNSGAATTITIPKGKSLIMSLTSYGTTLGDVAMQCALTP